MQSGVDCNLNGDSAGDRSILNPSGVKGTGSGVTALTNSAGKTVGYLATNPNAQYIVAGVGAWPTAGRNTLPTAHINNVDFSITKKFNITEGKQFQFGMQASNLFNHPQFVPGAISNIYPQDTHLNGRNFLIPGNRIFNDFSQAFSSNLRTIGLVARITL